MVIPVLTFCNENFTLTMADFVDVDIQQIIVLASDVVSGESLSELPTSPSTVIVSRALTKRKGNSFTRTFMLSLCK